MKKIDIKTRAQKGFTLIELMVSICIFVLFIGIAINAYINIVHAQTAANNNRKMYSEVRSFVENISTELRSYTVAYDCYKSVNLLSPDAIKCPVSGLSIINGETNDLLLISPDKQKMVDVKFDKSNNTISTVNYLYNTVVNDYEKVDSDDNMAFSSAVTVNNLVFKVFPDVNPYSSEKDVYSNPNTQFQPKVTVLLSTKPSNDTDGLNVMNFQTTISSRVYNR